MVTRTGLKITFIPTSPVLFYTAEPFAVERTTSSLHSVWRRRPLRSLQLSPALEKIGGGWMATPGFCPILQFLFSQLQSSDLVTRQHTGCYLCCICNMTAPSCGFTATALFLGSNTFFCHPISILCGKFTLETCPDARWWLYQCRSHLRVWVRLQTAFSSDFNVNVWQYYISSKLYVVKLHHESHVKFFISTSYDDN
jgi:hypothetical protein